MSAPFDWLPLALEHLAAENLVRRRRSVRPLPHGYCEIDGQTLANFAGNDYLGLSLHPHVIAAATQALHDYGTGARASQLVTGRSILLEQLEHRLASFKRQSHATLFPTGYGANIGTITSLVSSQDALYSDQLNHASLVDGCRLSKATLHIYRHNDPEHLQQFLDQGSSFRRRLIVTESIFSMDGDVAPLEDLVTLAEKYSAMLLLDEAHATGVLGQHASGLLETLNDRSSSVITVGTLSKAIGALGGFVAGSKNLCDWLWNSSRTQIFSTALPPSVCAAAIAALDLIEHQPEHRHRLFDNIRYLHLQLKTRDLLPGNPPLTPILPLIVGSPRRVLEIGRRLEQQGFLVGTIRPPSVPQNSSRLRISLSALHLRDDIYRLAAALDSALREFPPGSP